MYKIILTIVIAITIMCGLSAYFIYSYENKILAHKKAWDILEKQRAEFLCFGSKKISDIYKKISNKDLTWLNIVFNKSIEYMPKYIDPKFILAQTFQESRYDEKAKGADGEIGRFQFGIAKQYEASLIYNVSIDEFNNNDELQTDFYFKLMTQYLKMTNSDYEKALLLYNCGENILILFDNNVEYIKKIIYTEHKRNPRKAYSDVVLKTYESFLME